MEIIVTKSLIRITVAIMISFADIRITFVIMKIIKLEITPYQTKIIWTTSTIKSSVLVLVVGVKRKTVILAISMIIRITLKIVSFNVRIISLANVREIVLFTEIVDITTVIEYLIVVRIFVRSVFSATIFSMFKFIVVGVNDTLDVKSAVRNIKVCLKIGTKITKR